jgi:hypothetical protein
VRYVAFSFLKPEQAPAPGWRGHRYSASRDYLVRPTKTMRMEARTSLQRKRALWRAQQCANPGADAELAEFEALVALDAAAATTWELRRTTEHPLLGIHDLGPAQRTPVRLGSAR